MTIKGLFFSEFDNIAGPVIVFQAPDNLLSAEAFDSISSYIIIDKALCNKIITVSVQQLKIVGYPVCIEDDKYHRNALLFNIGFVFDEPMKTTPYRPILRKLGAHVESMEKESGFLSRPDRKAQLAEILPRLLRDLMASGEATIPIDAANVLNLKLFPSLPDPAPVFDYQVPVAIRDLRQLLDNSAEWDLALQQIVPFIDGVKYVKRISMEADVEIAIVKKCLRQLLYYGCITMIDIFLHSNIYTTTPQISMLAKDQKIQAECALYITKAGRSPPPFARIFALYCSMQPSLRMSDFCLLYAESLVNVDVRRFITFGLIHAFLRRVHRYPIFVDYECPKGLQYFPRGYPKMGTAAASAQMAANNSMGSALKTKSSSPHFDEERIVRRMDGTMHTDEICVANMIRFSDLEGIVSRNPNVYVVHK